MRKVADKHCTWYSQYDQYTHLEDAFERCRNDAQCKAIYDESCDGKGSISLCRSFESIIGSTTGSCVYTKKNSNDYRFYYCLRL